MILSFMMVLDNSKQSEIVNMENLNFFSKFISNFLKIILFYTDFAIIIAIILGTFGAGARRLLSRYKYLFLIKKKLN